MARGSSAIESKYRLGSGGGSGGSIQLVTPQIEGDGLIDLSGGDGVQGGGGGSGGVLIVNLLENEDILDPV